MYHEAILGGESSLVLFASLGLLALSVWKKEEMTSEATWDRLIARSRAVRSIFALSFFSLVIYLLAQTAELISLSSPSTDIEGIHELGETIHMLVAAAAVFATIPLFSEMLGAKNVP